MTDAVKERANALFAEQSAKSHRDTDRVFAALLLVQWLYALVVSFLWSPYAWAGKEHAVHLHVQIAIVGGFVLNSAPLLLVYLRPGEPVTRMVVAVAQMLWSALLIHLTGGRIETHFHVFGSLAFLAFYRDWRVFVPATIVVATDHVIRQFVYPESVYGISNPEWWRFIEHALWVVFEDIVLVYACLRGAEELRVLSERQAQIEALREVDQRKTESLDQALAELRASQEAMLRTEKLAAVGQLAASVGHELRNPLAAIQNAHQYLAKRLATPIAQDARLTQFSGIIDKELAACTRIIGDLLDFARERPLSRSPCPLRPLVDDAIAVVPRAEHVDVKNDVPVDLPVPHVDRDQLRQVVVNLVQNAVEAIPAPRRGTVRVVASGGDGAPWSLQIADDGHGMPKEVVDKVFQPLYTTKTKGTGLGLAIVAGIVQRHGGTIRVDSQPERGTTFTIGLPAVG